MKKQKTKNAVYPGAARAKSSGGSCQFASSVPFVERESITVTAVTPPVPSEEKGCDAAVFDAFDEIVRKMERLEDLADMLDEEVATDWCLYADTDGRQLSAAGCLSCFNSDGTESGCTHEETKKQDERKAEQRDEQYDNSSESSNDDGHAPWGYLRKDETIEDRMRLTQLVDAIERGGFDEHSDNFMGRCLTRMYAWGNDLGLKQSEDESKDCRAGGQQRSERFGPSTVDWIVRRAFWAWYERTVRMRSHTMRH